MLFGTSFSVNLDGGMGGFDVWQFARVSPNASLMENINVRTHFTPIQWTFVRTLDILRLKKLDKDYATMKKLERLDIRISPRQKEQLQAIAGDKGASALVRDLITKHIAKQKG